MTRGQDGTGPFDTIPYEQGSKTDEDSRSDDCELELGIGTRH